MVKFGRVVFKIVSGQTDRQTRWSQYFNPYRGKSNPHHRKTFLVHPLQSRYEDMGAAE